MTGATVTDRDLRLALAAFRAHGHVGVLRATRYRMRFLVWGSGPPIVFVHGMSDRARAFMMVMHGLSERHTCIAYELPEGASDGAALAGYTHREYTADLGELLDHLGYLQAALLGSSFGSTIAIAALASVPWRFTHGILQGGFAHRPLTRAQRFLCQMSRYWPGWFGDWPSLHEQTLKRLARPTYSMLPPVVRGFFLANGGKTAIRAAALRTLTIDRLDLRPMLPGIDTPVLLLGGDCDRLVPRKCEIEIEDTLPQAVRIELPGCGHYPQYTHPREMAQIISAFLGSGLPHHGALEEEDHR